MSRRSFRIALVVVVSTFVVALAVGIWGYARISRYPDQPHHGPKQDLEVIVPPGAKFVEVARLLAAADVIDRPTWFRLYATHRDLARKVRAGRYVLRGDLTPREVLDRLIQGTEGAQVTVTVPEGKNMLEVFALLAATRVSTAAELERVAGDPEWLASQGIDGDTPEGYLFPETYRFELPSRPEKVLETMVRQHRAVYAALKRKHAGSAERLRAKLAHALAKYRAQDPEWEDRQFVIMASIVEKEAVVAAERPVIASVFYNRLLLSSFKTHRLETDPTIRYGCTVPRSKSRACQEWDAAGRLYQAQLDDVDNPYNTYQHKFLPPGPIGNPGRASLEAALAPAKSDYLFFVAKKDKKNHVFSKTYAEHARGVRELWE